ncbi:MAG: SCP2 sterol-binding domain-containing protein [Gammaproteobacteria bacterium]|nr:SCP2 sterol-binding domain-containing protein [Gammaproteobacteria bacterium]
MKLPEVLIATLENAFNRILALDPEAVSQLAAMQGRIICLQLDAINVRLYLLPSAAEVMVFDGFDAAADTTISGTPLALAKLGMAEDSQAEMFSGEVKISGDLKLGRQFSRLLASLDIDWEEQLSKVTGDMTAHTVANIGRSLFSLKKRNSASMKMNMGEYLQEEIHYLPSRNETESFLKDIDDLRNDVSRLKARLQKMEQKKIQDSSDTKVDNK